MHIVSLSGGKDSTAMLLRMFEEGWQVDEILFCDTGLEFEGLKWKKEYMEKTFPDEFTPDRWNIDVDRLFEEESCPYCHLKLEEKTVIRCDANGGCDVLALCKECLRTWKWYRNATGWSRDMEEYFFG